MVRSRAPRGDRLVAINACKQREPRATMRATMRATAAIRRHGRNIYDDASSRRCDTMSQVESSRVELRRAGHTELLITASAINCRGMRYRCKLIGTLNGDVDFYATFVRRATVRAVSVRFVHTRDLYMRSLED